MTPRGTGPEPGERLWAWITEQDHRQLQGVSCLVAFVWGSTMCRVTQMRRRNDLLDADDILRRGIPAIDNPGWSEPLRWLCLVLQPLPSPCQCSTSALAHRPLSTSRSQKLLWCLSTIAPLSTQTYSTPTVSLIESMLMSFSSSGRIRSRYSLSRKAASKSSYLRT